MNFKVHGLIAAVLLTVGSAGICATPSASLDTELLAIQQSWAEANYSTANEAIRKEAFRSLSQRAAAFVQRYPGRAEPLIWEGIVLSSYAGAKGGLGALSLAKQAREKLQAALKIDPAALDGSAYTSLGTLYYKVPGFPLGFGDHDQAAKLLHKALELNPTGIDPNYFYGELLFEDGQYEPALRHLKTALAAPARPQRELADAGRRKEIEALLEKVQQKLS